MSDDIEKLLMALAGRDNKNNDDFKNQKEAVKHIDKVRERIGVINAGDYVMLNEKEGHNFKFPKKERNQIGLVLEVGPWLSDNDSTCDNCVVLVALDKNNSRVFRMAEHLLQKVNVLKAVKNGS